METQNKIEHKRKRFAARLKYSKNLIFSKTPEKNLILCNVGQGTGLPKELLLDNINNIIKKSSMPKYIAKKGETYSFLIFEDVSKAKNFYENNNGLIKLVGDSVPNNEQLVYLAYINSVPNDEVIYDKKDPKGLHILTNFINDVEEEKLLNIFDFSMPSDKGVLKNRQVKHFGFEFRYGSNDVDLSSPLSDKIPDECNFLWPRLTNAGIKLEREPDQLTVNKYEPGQGIPSHVDKHSPFGDVILSLSLGSDILMDWKHSGGQYVPVHVPARSMLVMTDEARYDWRHGIQARTWDPVVEERATSSGPIKVLTNDTVNRGTRISLTFRWTRSGPCHCQYKTLCNTEDMQFHEDIENKLASKLEYLHVHQVYEQIAGHFSTTRHKPWPKVVDFMKTVPSGSVVIDLGCGNGKNILRRNDILQIGAERSSGLLEECSALVRQAGRADCVRLDLLDCALADRCADAVICIAVIHHFSNKTRRIQAISTISRLLRPGGKALITVWARDQTKSNYLDKNKSQPTDQPLVSVGGVNLPVHENRTQFLHNDLLVPWKLRNLKNDNTLSNEAENTLLRYYHVFEERELDNLCSSVAGLRIENSFYEEGNWCVVCEKI